MKNKNKIIFIFVISYILNFIWENLHFSLYSSNSIGISNEILLMLYASFIDAFYITLIFLLIALINSKINWRVNNKNLVLYSGLLVVISFIIKIIALKSGRWVYSSSMPVIFGMGISPLIQLAVTGIISLILVNKIHKD